MRSPRCSVEVLDRRVLLAAGWSPAPPAYLIGEGVLTIIGTDYKDVVRLKIDAASQQILVESHLGTHRSIPLADVQQVRVWAYDGDDLIDCGGLTLPVTVYAGGGSDTVIGTMQGDEIHAGAGRDFIRAVGGNDTVYGGADSDEIYLGSGDDVAYGRDGDDRIRGQLGSDAISGEAGMDHLFGDRASNFDEDLGNDTLWGGADPDSLVLGRGASIAHGEDGGDTLSVSFRGTPIAAATLVGGSGNDQFYAPGHGVQELDGGDGFDYASVAEGDNLRDIEQVSIQPGGELVYYPRTSALHVADGLLHIYGTPDADEISAAVEFDRLLISFRGVQVNLALGLTGARIWGGLGDDLIDFSEFGLPVIIFGGAGNDTLIGSSAVDELHGGAGADSLSGLAGNDGLYGGEDDDTLIGGDGDDSFYGRAGADLVNGGDGEDTRQEEDALDTVIDVELATVIYVD